MLPNRTKKTSPITKFTESDEIGFSKHSGSGITFSIFFLFMDHVQKCPIYKMRSDQNVRHPPLQAKPVTRNGPYFSESLLVGLN